MSEWKKEDGNYFLPRVVPSLRECFFPLIFLEIGDLEFTLESGSNDIVLFEVGDDGCADYLGCMDSAASNYNENAIQDDGSCEYDCSFFVDDNGTPYESLEINLDGGFYQAEIGWEIVDADGIVVMADGAPYADVTCLPVGCYDLNMSDSFGDGWNGNIMTIETGSGFTWTFEGPTDPYPNGDAATGTFATGDQMHVEYILDVQIQVQTIMILMQIQMMVHVLSPVV